MCTCHSYFVFSLLHWQKNLYRIKNQFSEPTMLSCICMFSGFKAKGVFPWNVIYLSFYFFFLFLWYGEALLTAPKMSVSHYVSADCSFCWFSHTRNKENFPYIHQRICKNFYLKPRVKFLPLVKATFLFFSFLFFVFYINCWWSPTIRQFCRWNKSFQF